MRIAKPVPEMRGLSNRWPHRRLFRRTPISIWGLLALVLGLGCGTIAPLQSAEEPDPAPPTNRPNPEALRSRFRNNNLTREERENRLRELRGRLNASTNRTEIERRREEWRKLSPAERDARVRDFRDQNLSPRSPRFNRLTPAERETKRSEFKTRIDRQVQELELRRATAPLSLMEERRLDRFRRWSRSLAPRTGREGANLPPPRPESAPKP